MAFHPATILAGWGFLALLAQQAGLVALASACAAILPFAFVRAPDRTLNLLRRARWLLLSIAVLFAFATPGRPLAAGMTVEGLEMAMEHGLRLSLLLASLAVVHEILGNAGLLSGLHLLLAPLGSRRNLRPRIVARLLLVLEYVERGPGAGGWKTWLSDPTEDGVERLGLPAHDIGVADWLAVVLLAGAVAAWSFLA